MTRGAAKSFEGGMNFFIFCLFILTGITSHSFANIPNASFVVKGMEMQYEPKKNQSDVLGNAHATRTLPPSTASGLPRTQTLTADRFHINFINTAETSTSQESSQDIDTIEANGHVFFQEEDLSIQAERCTYDCKMNTITCDQNIILTKGPNTLKGDKATANLDSGCYSVTASSKSDKVQAVLLPNRLHD